MDHPNPSRRDPESDDRPSLFKRIEKGEYVGNMFGWKFSMIGLAVIGALFALLFLRWLTMGDVPATPPDEMPGLIDSIPNPTERHIDTSLSN